MCFISSLNTYVDIHSRRKGRATFTPTTNESFARKRRSFVDGFRLISSIPIRRDTPDSSNEILYRPLRRVGSAYSVSLALSGLSPFFAFGFAKYAGE